MYDEMKTKFVQLWKYWPVDSKNAIKISLEKENL